MILRVPLTKTERVAFYPRHPRVYLSKVIFLDPKSKLVHDGNSFYSPFLFFPTQLPKWSDSGVAEENKSILLSF